MPTASAYKVKDERIDAVAGTDSNFLEDKTREQFDWIDFKID